MSAPPEVSIVVPVFNEEENLPHLLPRLTVAAGRLRRPYEIVVVDDGSRDRSAAILSAAAARDRRLVVVELNRNYGQHAAVFAGFETARGDILVTIDADLQNPPEEIPALVAKIDEGYDMVGTVRRDRRDPRFRLLASRVVNRFTRLVTHGRLSDYGCMLRAYHRSVVRAICASGEVSTFIPVLADLFAGRVAEIPVAHEERARGKSKYGPWRLLRLLLDLMTGFSLLPLRMSTALGLLTSAVSMIAAIVLVAGRIVYGSEWAVSGVFTLFAVLFLFIGIVLLAIGSLGEYVGRVYVEVRRRPRYVIRRVLKGEAVAKEVARL
jgi:undecaprenyl-phosphate 4-deoxy-4-formamido-L-arabinose transferase